MSQIAPRQIPVNNGLAPTEDQGPRALFVSLALSANVPFSDDLTIETENGTISNVQAVYIDNSYSGSGIFSLSLDSGQVITVKANTQGYFPIFTHAQVRYTAQTAGTSTVKLTFLNFPLDPSQWATQ